MGQGGGISRAGGRGVPREAGRHGRPRFVKGCRGASEGNGGRRRTSDGLGRAGADGRESTSGRPRRSRGGSGQEDEGKGDEGTRDGRRADEEAGDERTRKRETRESGRRKRPPLHPTTSQSGSKSLITKKSEKYLSFKSNEDIEASPQIKIPFGFVVVLNKEYDSAKQ